MKVKAVAKPSAKSLKPKSKKFKPDLVKVKKSKKLEKTENESSEGENSILKVKSKSDTKQKSTTKTRKSKGKDNFLVKHKKDLEGLKDIDPEFYQFLKQNDKKLLEFDFDDSDDENDDDDAEAEDKKGEKDSESGDDEGDEEDEERVHKPSGELEVASDESDFEADGEDDNDDDDGDEDKEESGVKKSKTITLKLLKTWQVNLQEKHPSIETIRKIIKAFSSALSSLTGEKSKLSVYKVEGSAIFNGIVQLCVINLQPAIMGFLGFHQKSKRPLHKCKKWKRIRNPLRGYLTDLMKLLDHVSSSNILTVLLKHLHQMSNMLGSFTSISKTILKRLIVLWSTSEETVRVLSFLCILKITRDQQITLLNHVLKAMYLSYIRNSKFVSPNTLPSINFMRRSLVEMFALDLNVSYQHVFLYIRQLAIHLRNAIILKKKDSFQAIYNWQYINSIHLWSDLLGITSNKPQLQPLIYPLVNITIGVIKLIPTAQYFPLRFHCIQTLINLQSKSNIFIPILPFILEVLNSNTFNKKHTVVSMKPLQFTCILRLNKSQLCENGFRNEVIENVFNLILQYLSNESSSLSYSDLIVPTVYNLKNYIKICKNTNYIRKLKQLLDKIIENSKFIDNERQKITFDLKNSKEIQAWETKIKNNGTPLNNYYMNWLKTHEMKKRRQAADTDEINKYDIPFIKRRKIEGNNADDKTNNDKDVELFPSDDEDDDDDIGKQLLNGSDQDELDGGASKNKKKNKKSKKQKQNIVQKQKNQEEEEQQQQPEDDDDFNDAGEVDIVKDLDIDDW